MVVVQNITILIKKRERNQLRFRPPNILLFIMFSRLNGTCYVTQSPFCGNVFFFNKTKTYLSEKQFNFRRNTFNSSTFTIHSQLQKT